MREVGGTEVVPKKGIGSAVFEVMSEGEPVVFRAIAEVSSYKQRTRCRREVKSQEREVA